MGEPFQQNIILAGKEATPVPSPRQDLATPGAFPNMVMTSPEGYKLYERLIDSDALFLSKLTRLLYSADLIKTNNYDPESPIPGYTLAKFGGKNGKHNPSINFEGYTIFVNNVLMYLSEALSTSDLQKENFDIRVWAIDATMNLVDMLCQNYEKWQFDNPSLIKPVGLAIYGNIVAIASRSSGTNKLINKVFHPSAFAPGPLNPDLNKPKVQWLGIGQQR